MLLARRAAAALLPLILTPPATRPAIADDGPATAIFSAGDPRYLQPAFDDIKYLGITDTQCGRLVDAASGETVLQAVKVEYKASKLSYKRVLGAFWRGVDPTTSAEAGQFGSPGPTVIWVSTPEERAAAEGSRKRLDLSGLYKGEPIATEVRDARSLRFDADAELTGWYKREEKAYASGLKKSGRTAWFEDRYKPVKTTACEIVNEAEFKGNVCGFVYFPCTDENGCRAVLQGTW